MRKQSVIIPFLFLFVVVFAIHPAYAGPIMSVPITAYLPMRLEIRYTVPTLNVVVNVSATVSSESALWGGGATRVWLTVDNATDVFMIDVTINYDVLTTQILTYGVWGAGVLLTQPSVILNNFSKILLHFEITTQVKQTLPTKEELAEAASEKVVDKLNTRLENLSSDVRDVSKKTETTVSTAMQWIVIVASVASVALFMSFYMHGRVQTLDVGQKQLWERAIPKTNRPQISQRPHYVQRPQQVIQKPVQKFIVNPVKPSFKFPDTKSVQNFIFGKPKVARSKVDEPERK